MTGDADHRELRSLLGAYLLGGLDGADRIRLEDHLAGCRDCGRELARLAPVPGLLSRLHEHPQPAPAPAALQSDLLPRLLDEARRERRGLRRRAVLTTLAGAAAVAAVVVAGASIVSGPDQPAATTVALRAATGYDSAGSAALTAKPWGTAMTLQLRQLPPSGPFRLEVTGRDGSRQIAATWGATPTGKAVVSAATALASDQVRLVRVLGPDGPILEGGNS